MRVVAALLALATAGQAFAEPADHEALAHLDRGIAAYRLGDFATARSELGAAIELVPDRANAYRWRALVEERQHDCTNALVDVESFLSRAPAGDERVVEMTALRDRCVHVAAVTAPVAPPPATLPIYERWWFWTAIGVVVLTGVAIAATRSSDSTLPTVHCTATGCAP